MEWLIEKLMNQSMGSFMDESRFRISQKDETYQKDEHDLGEIEKKFIALNLPEDHRRVIEDYIACLQTADSRYADLSYMAGIEDAVSLLKTLNLIKNNV